MAINTYKKPLALAINYNIYKQNNIIHKSAKTIWLPPPTKVDIRDAILCILKERYKIITIKDEPEWAKKHKLPKQNVIEEEVSNIDNKIFALKKNKDSALEKLQQQQYFKKLLYEKHLILQEVVLKSLEILGAKIEEGFSDNNEEDGRIIDPVGRKYIIEIKGKKGQLQRDDIRQLDDWVKKAILEENWEGKGVIVGNFYNDIDIQNRENPIHNNEEIALGRFNFSVITTTQLFCALVEYQNGNFQQKNFWDTIFNTDGLCTLTEVIPQ